MWSLAILIGRGLDFRTETKKVRRIALFLCGCQGAQAGLTENASEQHAANEICEEHSRKGEQPGRQDGMKAERRRFHPGRGRLPKEEKDGSLGKTE